MTNKTVAAVCSLYCEGCSLYIATTEDPDRLRQFAARFHMSEEAVTCHGCRSDKRGPYCRKCKMSSCAAGKGIDFCVECREYPCKELKEFQAAMPHRIELWKDAERIKTIGYAEWLREARERYACDQCNTINSAYDLKCRKCGNEPSCEYVRLHKQEIEKFLQGR